MPNAANAPRNLRRTLVAGGAGAAALAWTLPALPFSIGSGGTALAN